MSDVTPKPNNRSFPTANLQDAFAAMKNEIFASMNCMKVGEIQSFNAETQQARVKIAWKKTRFVYKGKDDTRKAGGNVESLENELVEHPILIDVPVMSMRGSKDASLRFPIKAGVACLVFFSDRDIDNWFEAGNTELGNATARMHSLADGIALVGVSSLADLLEGYSSDRVELMHKQVMVSLGEEKLKIANATRNLKTLLDELMTALTSASIQVGAEFAPAPFATGTINSLNQVKTKFGELFE